ncbi:MAG TPA: FHA domain-containing protein, partial [Bacteroidia bacterium]|nr:FHA domain-containing protein [Bacteroidia bacterium]
MIKITIGAAPTNSVVLNHPSVSPLHLEIVQDDAGNYLLTDLSSAYGTFVNGYRVQGVVQLRNTDIVMAGQITLPWQNYFMYQAPTPGVNQGAVQNTTPPFAGTVQHPQYGNPPVTDNVPPVKKSKKKVLLFVGGG